MDVRASKSDADAARAFSDAELDRVNAQLGEIRRTSLLHEYNRSGELLLNTFYSGDQRVWESRAPAKESSLRRLAVRPNAPYGKDALRKRIGVHVALRAHPKVLQSRFLSASHVVEVLRLEPREQAAMLKRAERERWSVRELHKRVVDGRKVRGERRGRSPVDALDRVSASVSALRSSCKAVLRTVAAVPELSDATPNLVSDLRVIGALADGVIKRLAILTSQPRLAKASVSREQPIGHLADHPSELQSG